MTLAQFNVTFATTTPVFRDFGMAGEVAWILREIAKRVEDEGSPEGTVRDSQDHDVGRFEFVEAPEGHPAIDEEVRP